MQKKIQIEIQNEVLSLVTDIAFSNVPCWYDAARRDLHMDLIIPKRRQGHAPCPVVIWICGGSYMVVDHSVWMPELVRFARAGYVVASIEYRTSNEAQFPAQLVDVKSAVRYLRAHAQEYCVDPAHIFVMGESAGGTMASLLGTTNGKTEYEQGDNLAFSSSVQGIVDFYGLADLRKVSQNTIENVPSWTVDAFLGAGYTLKQAEAASAVCHVSPESPPFFILHGTEDAVVPAEQSRQLYDVLEKNGVRTEYLLVEGAEHGDDRFYQDSVTEEILRFLKDCLNPDAAPN